MLDSTFSKIDLGTSTLFSDFSTAPLPSEEGSVVLSLCTTDTVSLAIVEAMRFDYI